MAITKDRIESKVEPVTESGCWIWKGATTSRGYGQLIDNNKKHYAHRASYKAFVGDIPDGMVVCHSCDNVYCVNPAHLFLGTQKDNLQDMANKGRSTKGERNPNSKLWVAQVKGIKLFIRAGCSDKELSLIFNVCRQTINNIRNGKVWSHV